MRVVLALSVALALPAAPAAAWSPPRREPEQKARDCPEVGAGYVRVAGSNTCIRLGGLVRVEAAGRGGSR